ncbi:MAG: hypothetical protein KUL77_09245 [Thermomonas sp.]|uniref:hypothetical protein n=1 Tax=Thermomonas sp. TaxID=1971895 RepID=UPI001EC1CAC0|nr:hypothetical protein [Thermomonas sp.]MBV2209734.1 hypothetical protein [Thermomonas sp.]
MANKRKDEHTLPQISGVTQLLALGCGAALLLWLAALLGLARHAPELPAETGKALPQITPQTVNRVGSLSQYAQAVERPLFTENRRPRAFVAAVMGEGADSEAAALDFMLTGVLISPNARLAMLQPSGGGDTQRVREGAEPEGATGWRLLEVQPRRAVFEGPGGQVTLDLRTQGGTGKATSMDAEAAAVGAVPPPPPPPPPSSAASTDQSRVEDIRRRIEARRAELQQQTKSNGSGGLRLVSEPEK